MADAPQFTRYVVTLPDDSGFDLWVHNLHESVVGIHRLLELAGCAAYGDHAEEVPLADPNLDAVIQRAKLALRDVHALVDPDDAGEGDDQVALMRCLDAFDDLLREHEKGD